ncbi:hypothetical protein D3C79_1047300 [compost metagenome]
MDIRENMQPSWFSSKLLAQGLAGFLKIRLAGYIYIMNTITLTHKRGHFNHRPVNGLGSAAASNHKHHCAPVRDAK